MIQHVQSSLEIGQSQPMQRATSIPALTHIEAGQMATVELERFLALLATLSDTDWTQSTVCPLWDVRQLVAHVAGATAAYTSWAEFKRQNNMAVLRPYMQRGLNRLDAMNQVQVDDRAAHTTEELIQELRLAGPQAIRTRQRLPWLVRTLRFPFGYPLGFAPIGYLTDLIYTRDMWMHRLDICHATGKPMALTADHDGRVIALVIRDLTRSLQVKLKGQSIMLSLTGVAGGSWRVGKNEVPAATLQMDVIDFALLTSGRMSADNIASCATLDGNQDVVTKALANMAVPY